MNFALGLVEYLFDLGKETIRDLHENMSQFLQTPSRRVEFLLMFPATTEGGNVMGGEFKDFSSENKVGKI